MMIKSKKGWNFLRLIIIPCSFFSAEKNKLYSNLKLLSHSRRDREREREGEFKGVWCPHSEAELNASCSCLSIADQWRFRIRKKGKDVWKWVSEREREREKQFSLNRMSSLEMKNFFPSQSKWNFPLESHLAIFELDDQRVVLCWVNICEYEIAAVYSAHTLCHRHSQWLFTQPNSWRISQIFHSCSFQFQNFFDWFFFVLCR